MKMQAWYSTDDTTLLFTAEQVREDIGVERSHYVWKLDPGSIRLEQAELFGCDLPLQNVPEQLMGAFLKLAADLDFQEAEGE
jgi:hypothetical protein